jgi:hypothetical protein
MLIESFVIDRTGDKKYRYEFSLRDVTFKWCPFFVWLITNRSNLLLLIDTTRL